MPVKRTESEAERDAEVTKDVMVNRKGTQILLPDGMSYKEGILWLQRKETEEETLVQPHDEFIGPYPLDALIAVNDALAEVFGWVQACPSGFFQTPPISLTVETSLGVKRQVFWGKLQIPSVDGFFNTNLHWAPGQEPRLIISGQIKKKHVPKFERTMAVTRRLLAERSIYRGKAIQLSYDWMRQGIGFDFTNHGPKFMDVSEAKRTETVFSPDVTRAIRIGLFTPIEKTERCRREGIPLKRGVLLEGPYGVGKTLTALETAEKAVENGWTFIYLKSVLDLKEGLQFAHAYQPAVLFVEDIDKALHEDHSIETNALLNILDGVDTKGTELIVVFTTNHVERLSRAFLRPGRLDTVVSLRPPDAATASKLVRSFGGRLLNAKADLTKVGTMLEGKIPAVIREVVERAKIAVIADTEDSDSLDGHMDVPHLEAASAMMEDHISLLGKAEAPKDRPFMIQLSGTKIADYAKAIGTPDYIDIADHLTSDGD